MDDIIVNYKLTELVIDTLNNKGYISGEWSEKITQCTSHYELMLLINSECTIFEMSELGSLRSSILGEFGQRVDWIRVTNYLIERYVQEGGKLPFEHNTSL